MRSDWKINTKLAHPKEVTLLPGNKSILQPIYQSAKFTPSENHPLNEQYIYSRISNPTLRQLELTLADLQGKDDCIVTASGIAAITGTFLGLLKAGDHFVTFKEIYKPARVYLRDILTNYGIKNTFLGLNQVNELENHILPQTRIIYFESPSNPNLSIVDINELVRISKKHNLILVMDGTFGGPHQHTQFDVDVMIHSLTKYVNGHGDVIAGSVAGRKDLIKKIKETAGYLGATLDPHAANLITRGLKTYLLRYQRQSRTALKIAQYLEKHPKISKVIYPGLESYPDFDLAQRQMKDMGGIIAFDIARDNINALELCHRVRLIQFTASLGSVESLICPSEMFFGLDLTLEDKTMMGINPQTVRLSVGLEDYEDLVKDLDQALMT